MYSAFTAIFSTQYDMCCTCGRSAKDAMYSALVLLSRSESQTESTSLFSLRWMSSDATGLRSRMEQSIRIGSQETKRPIARLCAWRLLPRSPKAWKRSVLRAQGFSETCLLQSRRQGQV